MPDHSLTRCTASGFPRYITGGGRGAGHSDGFTCPACDRKGRFALNWLGRRRIYCDGRRFHKLTEVSGAPILPAPVTSRAAMRRALAELAAIHDGDQHCTGTPEKCSTCMAMDLLRQALTTGEP